jgi:formate hydrogenlyase subunit 3/multisubunit Na+/H+ antiporter MnhD subunit
MKFFFDYIFYRVARFYFKWDKRHGITAISAITMIQALIISDFIGFVGKLFFDRSVTQNYVVEAKFIGISLFLILLFFNYKKYYGSYFKYKNYWKEESRKEHFVKGVLVLLSLIVPWIPLILMGIYW